MSMSGFKLLAIRPFLNCSNRFSKNLVKGVIYKFYQDYTFLDKEGKIVDGENLVNKDDEGNDIDNDVHEIRKNYGKPDDLYKITNDNGQSINVL